MQTDFCTLSQKLVWHGFVRGIVVFFLCIVAILDDINSTTYLTRICKHILIGSAYFFLIDKLTIIFHLSKNFFSTFFAIPFFLSSYHERAVSEETEFHWKNLTIRLFVHHRRYNYKWAKRTKILLTVIYGTPQWHSNGSGETGKNVNTFSRPS